MTDMWNEKPVTELKTNKCICGCGCENKINEKDLICVMCKDGHCEVLR